MLSSLNMVLEWVQVLAKEMQRKKEQRGEGRTKKKRKEDK